MCDRYFFGAMSCHEVTEGFITLNTNLYNTGGFMISLYIHIPFCKSKCKYCDFLSFPNTEYINAYKKALINEIKAFDCTDTVKSIFIGGGTPSIVDSSIIAEIMEAVSKFSILENAEITIEANPGTLTEEKLLVYKNSGINRISMGLQAWQNVLLKKLGRIHTSEEFLQSYTLAKKYFDNINIDLMFSLPDQTMDMWLETLDNVTALKPQHISAYSLIVEEGTPFYNMELNLPDEKTDREMYHTAISFLKDRGYNQYEISNFAQKGYESVHNSVYWQRGNYKGFGLGAASLVNSARYKNTENITDYIKGVTITEKEELTKDDEMAEFMFLGLRMTQGVSITKFKNEFGVNILEKYRAVINEYKDYIIIDNDRIRLTTEGIDISNRIFADML